MKKSRFSEEQIIGILKEQEAGLSVAELCRKHGMSEASFYTWKAKYGGLDVSEAMLDNAALKDLVKKVVTPAGRREAVTYLQATYAMSERRACAVIGADRSSARYRSTKPNDGVLRARRKVLAEERRRFGYRRLHVLLRREPGRLRTRTDGYRRTANMILNQASLQKRAVKGLAKSTAFLETFVESERDSARRKLRVAQLRLIRLGKEVTVSRLLYCSNLSPNLKAERLIQALAEEMVRGGQGHAEDGTPNEKVRGCVNRRRDRDVPR